ncbi:hypothetical protein ALC57_03552 [Trachymyrmex cornetzi]|uniref:Uncharacterized protein n=1 Tax=Trachymyrmex cornetzi TaxID=471704 RepID=A0A195EG44_9HYME|nr:hypothetical protein ALC57_03552 [Trachymyrmex cornetzi]
MSAVTMAAASYRAALNVAATLSQQQQQQPSQRRHHPQQQQQQQQPQQQQQQPPTHPHHHHHHHRNHNHVPHQHQQQQQQQQQQRQRMRSRSFKRDAVLEEERIDPRVPSVAGPPWGDVSLPRPFRFPSSSFDFTERKCVSNDDEIVPHIPNESRYTVDGSPGIAGLSREKKEVSQGFPGESRLACGLREGDVTKSNLRTSSRSGLDPAG